MSDNVRQMDAYRKMVEAGGSRGLKESDGDGTLPPMDLIDAKIEAAEARTDTKFAELRGELRSLAGKGTVWGAAGSLFVGVLAILAFAGDRFDAGMGTADSKQAQLARDNAQDATASDISNKLDLIIAGQKSVSKKD